MVIESEMCTPRTLHLDYGDVNNSDSRSVNRLINQSTSQFICCTFNMKRDEQKKGAVYFEGQIPLTDYSLFLLIRSV